MGKQHNKVEKQTRRKAYLKRKKVAPKTEPKAGKAAKAPAGAAAVKA